MEKAELAVFRDAVELAAHAAERITRCAAESIRERGRFTLALAGGSTPEKTYRLLAGAEGSDTIDWSNTYLFFGDERFVPHDDPRSNYQMVHEALLAQAPIAGDHVCAVPTELAGPAEAARAYGAMLSAFFGVTGRQMPVFDLILLGLGDDGHTASLFPGTAALEVTDVAVTWSPPGILPPPVDRVTLSYPALNAARQVIFLVAGANKAEAFRDVWEGKSTYRERPAAGIRPVSGQLTWLADRAAAAK